jgi:hypothetical protein
MSASSPGISRIGLVCVPTVDQDRAIEFYESIGASVMPDWRICRLTGDALRRI